MANINKAWEAIRLREGIKEGTLSLREFLDGEGFTGHNLIMDLYYYLVDSGWWVNTIPESILRAGSESTPVEPENPELIGNWDFDDTSVWVLQGNSVTFTSVDGVGIVEGPQFEGIRQTITTEAGEEYKLEYSMLSKASTVFVRVYNSDAQDSIGDLILEHTVSDLSGTFNFTATSEYTIIYLRNTSSGISEWDSVSVKKVS